MSRVEIKVENFNPKPPSGAEPELYLEHHIQAQADYGWTLRSMSACAFNSRLRGYMLVFARKIKDIAGSSSAAHEPCRCPACRSR